MQLLPEELFSRLLRQWQDNPKQLQNVLTELFAKMASGGAFGLERIPWFNAGLFDTGQARHRTLHAWRLPVRILGGLSSSAENEQR